MNVSLSTLRQLPPERQAAALEDLVSAARKPPNGQLTSINYEIEAFEAKYGRTSAKLLEDLRAKRLSENEDIARWLFLLQTRRLLRG
jgi:hypothetical protein